MSRRLLGAFNALHPKIKALLPAYGYYKPTPVQESAIPVVMKGYSTVIAAPTGSGKTEAAVLPIISKILYEGSVGKPQMIYITPLRALNRDIYRRMQDISLKAGLNVIVRHGDSSRSVRRSFLKNPPDWFITTPESLAMIITHKDLRKLVDRVKYIVIDEVHELIENERGVMLDVILERLWRLSGYKQVVCLSATIGDYSLIIKMFLRRFKYKILSMQGYRDYEFKVLVEENKDSFNELSIITSLIRRHKTVLVFTNTRDTAEILGNKLKNLGLGTIEVHHGSLSVNVRRSVEEKLKKGGLKAVIATSSLELGIDIGSIDLVIQYGSPRRVVKLIQRVGRCTHKLGGKARGIIIAEPSIDDVLESIVICRRALSKELEKPIKHKKPLDVMLHQIVGMVIAGEAKNISDVYNLLKNTYSYKTLDLDYVKKVVEFADSIGVLRVDATGGLKESRRSREYYYNTTMIPDTKRIPVYSLSGERIGFLDEEFVVSKVTPGVHIILAGREWRVVGINGDKVIVEESIGEAIPPYWEGDLIPVDRKVAREAMMLLRRIALGEDVDKLLKEYPAATKEALEYIKRVCNEASNRGFKPPHGDHILIEYSRDHKLNVIYTSLGSRGNEAFALLLTYYFNIRGYSAEFYTDPYRIFIKTNKPVAPSYIKTAIVELASKDTYFLTEVFKSIVKKSSLFYWRLTQVARKMGCIGGEASVSRVKSLVKYLSNTLAGEEAVREVLLEKMDLDQVLNLLRRISSGELKIFIQEKPGLSPYTLKCRGVARRYLVNASVIPEENILELFEKRIMSKKVKLLCLKCGWSKEVIVKDLPNEITCLKCKSKLITVIHPSDTEFVGIVKKYLRGEKMCRSEKEKLEDLVKKARIVMDYGKNGVIALVAYGVGPKSALKALSKLKLGWREFIKALYEEERRFVSTSIYWRK